MRAKAPGPTNTRKKLILIFVEIVVSFSISKIAWHIPQNKKCGKASKSFIYIRAYIGATKIYKIEKGAS